jgi:NADPH:quinone reductase-like Zn-dependent oxidoreductase
MAIMKAIGMSKQNNSHSLNQPLTHSATSEIKDGKGPIENLYMNDKAPRPNPTHAQALVRVKAFGLNRMDLMQREGHYPLPPQAPETLGVEFSGIIEELAHDSKNDTPEKSFKKGDEVFGLAYGGAYAEYIAVSTHMLVHKPKELGWEECSGIPEVSCTHARQEIALC